MQIAVAAHDRSWHWEDLCRAAAGRYRLTRVDLRQLQVELQPERTQSRISASGVCLNDFPVLLLLGIPGGSLEQVVFRMDALAALQQSGVRLLNPPRAIETCVDKYLTLERLRAAGLPVPRTIICQTPEEVGDAASQLGGELVLKPLFGSEGRGLERLRTPEELQTAAALWSAAGRIIYLQEFIPHAGWDLRLLVIGERIWAMRRSNPVDWRTNASRGATTMAWEATAAEQDLARRATAAVGASIAGVDLVYSREGRPFLLEVNSAPGWKYLSAATGSDIAAELLHHAAHAPAG